MEYELNSLHLVWALTIGGISAVSLPLGSFVGLTTRVPKWVLGSLSAFGGGALIAALSVELVAPTVENLSHASGEGRLTAEVLLGRLIAGSVLGGVLFVALNRIINEQGGFLRRMSTTITYFTSKRRAEEARLLAELSEIDIIRLVPEEEVRHLLDAVRRNRFSRGETIFRQGDPGDRMLFVRSGRLELLQHGERFKVLAPGTVVGEIALLTGGPRTMTVRALDDVEVVVLLKADLDRLRHQLPELDRAMSKMAQDRVRQIGEGASRSEERQAWAEETVAGLQTPAVIPSAVELKEEVRAHSGAPLAIWMGILLDGIPESFVIGSGFLLLVAQRSAEGGADVTLAGTVPYTLVAGLFLSNFPEALSSSVGMRNQGWGSKRIFLLWFVLLIFTSLGAGLGYLTGASVGPETIVLVQGVAAGAMLTMIASAMIRRPFTWAEPTTWVCRRCSVSSPPSPSSCWSEPSLGPW
jgi:CRP-like cAMP-binding protein